MGETILASLDIPRRGQVLDSPGWITYFARAGMFTGSGGGKSLVDLVRVLAMTIHGVALESADPHLEALMGWYNANCDGDWEHSYGVKIETTEEGGWLFQADLADTAYATDDLARRESRRSDADWLVVEIHDGAYRASGGGCSLIDIVAGFVAYVVPVHG